MAGLDGFYAARLEAALSRLTTVGPGAALRYVPAAGPESPAMEGGKRVDVARFGRGTDQAVRVSGARHASQARRPRDRASVDALAVFPGKTDRLVIAPQDLRTADATRASEIYAGRFVFAGKVVICDARSPFEVAPPSEDWAAGLLGFGWLRHLRAAESGITRANARALVDEWITLKSPHDPIAWRPEVMARRIISWLSQATLVLDDSDVRFYRRFLRSLTRQVRQLRHTVSDARDGVPRLQALIALTYAALCMAGQARHIRAATKRLPTSSSGRSCPTAAISAAIRAR